MEIPDWSSLVQRARYWVAFVGVRRLVTGVVTAFIAVIVLWLLMRPSDPPIEASLTTASEALFTSSSTPLAGTVTVHVMGAVKRPGVYELASNARVVDAVRAAGGAKSGADLERINLAQTIVDTEQVFVPTRQQRKSPITVAQRHRSSTSTVAPIVPGATPTSQTPTDNNPASGKINLNTATAEQLDTLPGVGPSTAKAIISYRTKSGDFKKVADLMNVPGIGQAKFEAVRDLVTV